MHAQPGDRKCSNPAIGGNHYGPVMVYLSKVSDAKTNVGDGSWFKVAEDGYNTATKKWGTVCLPPPLSLPNLHISKCLQLTSQDLLNDNCGKRSFKVPSNIAPGNYLLRAEAIALHAAQSAGGAQLYMTCFQINVSGSGTANPAGVKFPGAYKATDPGILINIYNTITSYIIPGPAVYTG